MDRKMNRNSFFFLAAAFILVSMCAAGAQAAIPAYINYQGKLTYVNGTNYNGQANMTFRIYNQSLGGKPMWSENQAIVNVTSGVFNALLGNVTALRLPFTTSYYLGVIVKSDGEMAPRQRISSVAYAYRANISDQNVKLSGDTMTGALNMAANITANANKTRWIGSPTVWFGKVMSSIFRGITAIFDTLRIPGSFYVYNNGTLNVRANYSVASGKRVIWSNGTVETGGGGAAYSGAGTQDLWVNETGDTMSGTLSITNGSVVGKVNITAVGGIDYTGNLSWRGNSTTIRAMFGPFTCNTENGGTCDPNTNAWGRNTTIGGLTTSEKTGAVPVRTGSVTGVSATTTSTLVLGTAACTLYVHKNGIKTNTYTSLTSTTLVNTTKQAIGVDKFAAGDVLMVQINTTSKGLNSCVDVSNVTAWIEVAYY